MLGKEGLNRKKMCKLKKYPRTSNTQVDKCMRTLIKMLNILGIKTVASCCGHGGPPMTIVVENNGVYLEICHALLINRKKNIYKKDIKGYYYIPEVRDQRS